VAAVATAGPAGAASGDPVLQGQSNEAGTNATTEIDAANGNGAPTMILGNTGTPGANQASPQLRLTPPTDTSLFDPPDSTVGGDLVATPLPPRALLARAQGIERAFGRNRANEQRWGPRPLDIDILAYDDLTMREVDLTLPHPHLFERAFVLLPLAEIASDRIVAGRRIGDALAALDARGIEKLPPLGSAAQG